MDSLLNQSTTNDGGGSLLGQTSVSDNSVMSSISETSIDKMESVQKSMEMEEMQRRMLLKNPEYQAAIVFENYIRSSNRVFSGQEKRRIRREILANAKRGKYNKMFSEEQMTSSFNSLNK